MASRYAPTETLSKDLEEYFTLERESDGWICAKHDFSENEIFDDSPSSNKPIIKNKVQLLRLNHSFDLIETYPICTLPTYRFLEQKYENIKCISFEGFKFAAATSESGIFDILNSLPSGFIKDPDYGLGIQKEFRFIIEAIANIQNVNHLKISNSLESKIDNNTYVLNFDDFDLLRKAINRTHNQALSISKVDKQILTYNSLLSSLDSGKYPQKFKPYKKDTIFKTLSGAASSQVTFSDKDNESALSIVKNGGHALVKRHQSELLELQRDIELVTLEVLIGKLGEYIKQNLNEETWQQLFLDNPFILSLAFGLPLVLIDGRVSVGGRAFSGKGDKVADFCYKNRFSDNITLIEIKTSKTKITGSKYRGVFAPSPELSGSINQILEQRYELQKILQT